MGIEDNRRNDHGDDVGALIRLAGQRPPIDEARVHRARAAARETWRRETVHRSRRRLFIGATALAAAAALVVLALTLRPSGPAVQTAGVGGSLPVELVAGAALVQEAPDGPAGAGLVPGARESLEPGTVIATSGNQRAALLLPTGHSLRLDRATQVRISGSRSIKLESGALYIASGGVGGSRADGLTVETPLGAVREIGTQFEVRLEGPDVRVRVREGAVVLSHDGQDHEARLGTELKLGAGGTLSESRIPTHGDGWEWVSRVAPMPSLEGQTARSFLEWMARERGWRLEFASEELGRSAATIELAGETRGMTLDQALASVMLSSQLAHRVEGGVLMVSRSEEL